MISCFFQTTRTATQFTDIATQTQDAVRTASNQGGDSDVTVEDDYDEADDDPLMSYSIDLASLQAIESLREKVSLLDSEKKASIGHQIETMLLKCSFQGYPCSPK